MKPRRLTSAAWHVQVRWFSGISFRSVSFSAREEMARNAPMQVTLTLYRIKNGYKITAIKLI